MAHRFVVEECALWSEKQDAMEDQWTEIRNNVRSNADSTGVSRRPAQRRHSTSNTFTFAIGDWRLGPMDSGLVDQDGVLPESQAWRRAQFSMEESWAVIRKELRSQMGGSAVSPPQQQNPLSRIETLHSTLRSVQAVQPTARLQRPPTQAGHPMLQSKGPKGSLWSKPVSDLKPIQEARESSIDDPKSEIEITPIKQLLIDELKHQGKRSALQRKIAERTRDEPNSQLSSPLIPQPWNGDTTSSHSASDSSDTNHRKDKKAMVRKLMRQAKFKRKHHNKSLEHDADASPTSDSLDYHAPDNSKQNRGSREANVPQDSPRSHQPVRSYLYNPPKKNQRYSPGRVIARRGGDMAGGYILEPNHRLDDHGLELPDGESSEMETELRQRPKRPGETGTTETARKKTKFTTYSRTLTPPASQPISSAKGPTESNKTSRPTNSLLDPTAIIAQLSKRSTRVQRGDIKTPRPTNRRLATLRTPQSQMTPVVTKTPTEPTHVEYTSVSSPVDREGRAKKGRDRARYEEEIEEMGEEMDDEDERDNISHGVDTMETSRGSEEEESFRGKGSTEV